MGINDKFSLERCRKNDNHQAIYVGNYYNQQRVKVIGQNEHNIDSVVVMLNEPEPGKIVIAPISHLVNLPPSQKKLSVPSTIILDFFDDYDKDVRARNTLEALTDKSYSIKCMVHRPDWEYSTLEGKGVRVEIPIPEELKKYLETYLELFQAAEVKA